MQRSWSIKKKRKPSEITTCKFYFQLIDINGTIFNIILLSVLVSKLSIFITNLALTLCKYDLRKEDLFVLSWARLRRVSQGSFSSELLICGGGVCSILLLPLVARCLEAIDVCIWHMFVFMSVAVTVWGLWECLLCSGRC